MTHASVFSGIGGPEVAATMLGWYNLFHCEINPFGRKFSKQFALNKQAQRVDYTEGQEPAVPSGDDNTQTGGGGTTGGELEG